MSIDRELSDLKLERKECPKCRAIWINGEHRWGGTGNRGVTLAGLYAMNMAITNVSIP